MQRAERLVGAGCRATPAVVFCLALFIAAGGCAPGTTKYPEVRAREGNVTIDLSGLAAGDGRFFTHRSASGKNVDFLVYRDSSGTPHAVLDACRTCYRWKKGYVIDGPEVVCLKCDMRFKIDALAAGTGSCIPIALQSGREGESLQIPLEALEAGARYFPR